MRICGECTACCKTHGIKSLNKMPGLWCEHCQMGIGCKIYNKRPDDCKIFQCVWLLGIGELRHRPDISGIVPEYREIPTIGIAMWFWEFTVGSLNSDFTKKWTRRNLSVGNHVMHVSVLGEHILYLPEGVSMPTGIFVAEAGRDVINVIPFS